jgi:hypothetical protein
VSFTKNFDLNCERSIPNLHHILRFLAHLIIILRGASYKIAANESANYILETYTSLLVAAGRVRQSYFIWSSKRTNFCQSSLE